MTEDIQVLEKYTDKFITTANYFLCVFKLLKLRPSQLVTLIVQGDSFVAFRMANDRQKTKITHL